MSRLMHTMIRVGNLQRSLSFYQEVMGMTLIRQKDYPHGRFTLAFLGYGSDPEKHLLELTFNWDKDYYELGEGFGHLAIGCEDIYLRCEEISKKGGKVIRQPGPMRGSTTQLAFVQDPDGYQIELIQIPHHQGA